MVNLQYPILLAIALTSGFIGTYNIIEAFCSVKKANTYEKKRQIMIRGIYATICLTITGILLIFIYSKTVVIDEYIRQRIEEEEKKLPEVGLSDD